MYWSSQRNVSKRCLEFGDNMLSIGEEEVGEAFRNLEEEGERAFSGGK